MDFAVLYDIRICGAEKAPLDAIWLFSVLIAFVLHFAAPPLPLTLYPIGVLVVLATPVKN